MIRRGHGPSRRPLGSPPFAPNSVPRIQGPPPVAQSCDDTTAGGIACSPAEVEQTEQERRATQTIKDAFRGTFVHARLSPLDAPSYRARIPTGELFARAVIAPPTTPGDADGAAGAAAIKNAEEAVSGKTVALLTPATTADFVEVLTFEVPAEHALIVKGVGCYGHDYRALRDVIVWRVRAGGKILATAVELALLGSVSAPALVVGVVTERQTLTVEAQNLDTKSASVVEARVEAWLIPVSGNADVLEDLLDPRAKGLRRDPSERRGC